MEAQAASEKEPAASNFGRRDEIKRENASNKKLSDPADADGNSKHVPPTHTSRSTYLTAGDGRYLLPSTSRCQRSRGTAGNSLSPPQ